MFEGEETFQIVCTFDLDHFFPMQLESLTEATCKRASTGSQHSQSYSVSSHISLNMQKE